MQKKCTRGSNNSVTCTTSGSSSTQSTIGEITTRSTTGKTTTRSNSRTSTTNSNVDVNVSKKDVESIFRSLINNESNESSEADQDRKKNSFPEIPYIKFK